MFFHEQELQYEVTPDAPDAVLAGTDLQHAILAGAGAGAGARSVDRMGNPWHGSYVTASANLLADFTAGFYGTTEIPNTVEKVAGTLQDEPNRE